MQARGKTIPADMKSKIPRRFEARFYSTTGLFDIRGEGPSADQINARTP